MCRCSGPTAFCGRPMIDVFGGFFPVSRAERAAVARGPSAQLHFAHTPRVMGSALGAGRDHTKVSFQMFVTDC